MHKKIDDILLEVVEEMLEELAFVFVVPEGCDDEMEDFFFDDDPDTNRQVESLQQTNVVARIGFTGPFEGILFLSVSEDMLPVLASNMLGLDDEDAPSQEDVEDAFREVLNVICGNLLPRIAGTEAVFDVSRAEVLRGHDIPAASKGKHSVGSVNFDLEIGKANLIFFSEKNNFETVDQPPVSVGHVDLTGE